MIIVGASPRRHAIAADAIPLAPNPVPSMQEGMLVSGKEPGRIRATPFDMEIPEIPKSASFFDQQARSVID